MLVAIVVGSYWFGTARAQNVALLPPAGFSYAYAFESRAEGTDTPAALFGANDVPGESFRLDVVGRLRITALASNTTVSTHALTFEGTRVTFASGAIAQAAYTAALERDLRGTFLERLAADGRIVAFVAPPGTSDFGSGYVRSLASSLEMSRPDAVDPFARSWEANEPDADGSRASTYALDFWLDSPGSVPTARFVRMASVTSPRGDARIVTPHVFAATFDQGTMRTDGALSHILATEKRGVRIGDRRIASAASTLDATLVEIAHTSATVSDERERQLAIAGGLYVSPSHETLRANAYRSAAARTTLGAILAGVRASAGRTDDTAGLSNALAAQFFASDVNVTSVAPSFSHAKAGSRVFETLKLGLQNAGTPAAQALMRETMLARAHDPVASELAASLARVAEPDRSTVGALSHLPIRNPQFTDVAILSLGTAANTLETSDPGLAREAKFGLVHELETTSNPAIARILLLGLGNGGSAHDARLIASFATKPDANLRAACAIALRSIVTPEADAALASLLRDPDDAVRLASAKAYADREFDRATYDAIVTVATLDSNRDVRVAAIETVANAAARFPEAHDVLARISANDREPRVRNAAKAGLTRLEAISNAERL